jgi:ribonuclease BN (tRNA processing enzyme)
VALGLMFATACAPDAIDCPATTGITLQVLGSGGPIADDARASSGYIVWVDGKAKVLIDTGGGTFLRFGESGAKFEDLEFVGLSHFHTDHSADFPALLKSGYFSDRETSLAVAGPSGDDRFPGLEAFLHAMFDPDSGAYAYLSGYLDGAGDTPVLVPREVGVREVPVVFSSDELRVDAMRVPHGIVPAVAFRVQVGVRSVVFGSDQNGSDPEFLEFAQGASVLVMHMAVPEDVTGVAGRLHARPSVIGEIAAGTSAERLVLSHFMARSINNLQQGIDYIGAAYGGDIVLAEDLLCVRIQASASSASIKATRAGLH